MAISSARLRVVSANTIACPPSWSWTNDGSAAAHHNFWCVHAGRGVMRLGAARVPLHVGRVLVLRPHTKLSATHEPANPLTVTAIHFHVLNARGEPTKQPTGLPPVHKPYRSVALFEAMCRRVSRLDALPGGPNEAAAYLAAMLIGLAEMPNAPARQSRTESLLDLAAEATEHVDRFRNVADLADAAGYGVDHFAELFRETVGQTPGAFLIEARVRRAEHLLAHSDMSITQIASAVGWRDAAFFCRQFKVKRGQTPSAFRRAAAQDFSA